MCYKYMWDTLVVNSFPYRQFYDCFALDPHSILSEEIRENLANSGVPAKVQNCFQPEIQLFLSKWMGVI